MRSNPRRQAGVTLVEVAVVLTVSAVLYTQAAPMFANWIGNAHTRTAAESILSGLQLARAEAVRRNRMVQFVVTDGASSSWLVGCSNPVDGGTPGVDDPGDCLGVIQSRAALETSGQPQLALTPATATTITFDSLGRVVGNVDGSPTATSIDVDNPNLASADRRVLRIALGVAGDVRMCDPSVSHSDPRGC
ncbi:MAG TPA: GspH/FimT family pseudopilin [Burkholderiaceae bacterium]|jgi:type IV fimbrial biogenesis protein FimT|nr:GspH/FimT family pseudopilin [Burkholderiaceae bacterium]